MEQWARVRRKLLVDGRSKRSVMSKEGLHWETLQKMLAYSRPPGYQRTKKRGRKIDLHVEWIRSVVDGERDAAPHGELPNSTQNFRDILL